jgi:hypothetical protein
MNPSIVAAISVSLCVGKTTAQVISEAVKRAVADYKSKGGKVV